MNKKVIIKTVIGVPVIYYLYSMTGGFASLGGTQSLFTFAFQEPTPFLLEFLLKPAIVAAVLGVFIAYMMKGSTKKKKADTEDGALVDATDQD